MKVKSLVSILVIFTGSFIYCQDWEIIPLTKHIGTVLDAEENLHYGVFTDVRGFESAQFYQIDENRVRVKIVYINRGLKKSSSRMMDMLSFIDLQHKMMLKGDITQEDRDNLKKDLIYIETSSILASIPLKRYVVIKRVQGRKVRGTLISNNEDGLTVKSRFKTVDVPITNLKAISYRQAEKPRPRLKWMVPLICSTTGFLFTELILPEDVKKTDRGTFYMYSGAAVGLTATKLVINKLQAYLTPMTSHDFTPEKIKQSKK